MNNRLIVFILLILISLIISCDRFAILSEGEYLKIDENTNNDLQLIFEDNFNRADGAANNDWSHTYHFHEGYNGSKALMIDTNVLTSLCYGAASDTYLEIASLYRNKENYDASILPIDIVFTIKFNTTAAWAEANYFYLVVGSDVSGASVNGTGVFLDGRYNKIGIRKNGATSNITACTLNDNITRKCRINIYSDRIKMKLWIGSDEPETWNLDIATTFSDPGNYLEIFTQNRSDDSNRHSFTYIDNLQMRKIK